MQWLDETTESPPESTRRGPPKLPGLPDIPPMPVVSSEAGPAPTNKTIEVEPQWLEQVEERRAKNKKSTAAQPAVRPAAPAPAATKRSPAPPRIRPIIPREDE